MAGDRSCAVGLVTAHQKGAVVCCAARAGERDEAAGLALLLLFSVNDSSPLHLFPSDFRLLHT